MPVSQYPTRRFCIHYNAFKLLVRITVVLLVLLFSGNSSSAQAKIGYINLDTLVKQMPESKEVEVKVEELKQLYGQILTDSLRRGTERNLVVNGRKPTEAESFISIWKLGEEYVRFMRLQNDFLRAIELKRNELNKPIIDTVIAAVETAAKKLGYTYVINTSKKEITVLPADEDLLQAVKRKLGLK